MTGRDIAFQRMGVLTIGGPGAPGSVELVRRNATLLRSHGVDARLVDARAMRDLVPGLVVHDGAVGCYEPDGAGVDPVKTVEAFAALAREAGAVTRVGERVREIVVDGGRVRGVRTDRGFTEAARVVVAAGPWSAPLLAAAGIDLPLTVVRPEQHMLAIPGADTADPLASIDLVADSVMDRFGVATRKLPRPAHPVILDVERGFYTRCEGHALRTRVGRMDHSQDVPVHNPDTIDESVGDDFRAWARAAITARMPRYADEPDAGSLVGLYTLTPDAQAAIGAWPHVAGLVIATGFSGHGFKLAPSIGEAVAQILAGEDVTAIDPAFFDPTRFRSARADGHARAFGL
jgi:glycine/D-amino acid oxidase-like deaminating enzyme